MTFTRREPRRIVTASRSAKQPAMSQFLAPADIVAMRSANQVIRCRSDEDSLPRAPSSPDAVLGAQTAGWSLALPRSCSQPYLGFLGQIQTMCSCLHL